MLPTNNRLEYFRPKMKAICLLPAVPCRSSASDKSEMTSQLIFGEIISVSEAKGDWWLVRNEADGYESWVQAKQLTLLSEKQEKDWAKAQKRISDRLFRVVSVNGENRTVPFGSILPGKAMNSEGLSISCEEKINPVGTLRTEAIKLLGCPYLWGGKTPMGLDCSGFVQLVFSRMNNPMPRDAYQQAEIGETIGFLAEAAEGDLAFFDNAAGHITHVGIVLKNAADDTFEIIHASGRVRCDVLDHEGIFNRETAQYSHKLRLIKRLVS
jgi:gamma-D-glutamyl-L-lysine dipeptidyl-peptidase